MFGNLFSNKFKVLIEYSFIIFVVLLVLDVEGRSK